MFTCVLLLCYTSIDTTCKAHEQLSSLPLLPLTPLALRSRRPRRTTVSKGAPRQRPPPHLLPFPVQLQQNAGGAKGGWTGGRCTTCIGATQLTAIVPRLPTLPCAKNEHRKRPPPIGRAKHPSMAVRQRLVAPSWRRSRARGGGAPVPAMYRSTSTDRSIIIFPMIAGKSRIGTYIHQSSLSSLITSPHQLQAYVAC